MLVISRKVGERIDIGADVEVAVIRIVGNRVRLGVTAPRNISVERLEVPHLKALVPSEGSPAPPTA